MEMQIFKVNGLYKKKVIHTLFCKNPWNKVNCKQLPLSYPNTVSIYVQESIQGSNCPMPKCISKTTTTKKTKLVSCVTNKDCGHIIIPLLQSFKSSNQAYT